MKGGLSLEKRFCRENVCIRTKKVYDWVTRLATIKIVESIDIKKLLNNCICCDFSTSCDGSKTTLWTNVGLSRVSASVVVRYCGGCNGEMDIFINGKKEGSIHPGQSFCGSFQDIEIIEVRCNPSQKPDGICDGELKINLHFDHVFDELINKNVSCFLSDCHGKKLDPYKKGSLECIEISDPHNRREVEVKLSNGKVIILQEVIILKRGFVTIEFSNRKGKHKKKCTFPFREVEILFLCAPIGTKIVCEITDFRCRAVAVPDKHKKHSCFDIVIILEICQSIEVLGKVKVELEAIECKPREDLFSSTICDDEIPPPHCEGLLIE